jgi:fucose 4-O-acetylase-like acetyltransferase
MQRDTKLDTVRGIAIVLIVFGHAVTLYQGLIFAPQTFLGGVHYTMAWSLDALVVDLTYAVALPLFGFVTGLTLFYSSRKGWDLVRARASTLLVPYLSWLAVGTVLVAVRSGIGAVPGNVVIGTVSAGASSSLWFLYALFVCVCVFAICRSDRALIITACIAPLVMTGLAWQRVDVLEIRDAAWLYAPLVVGYLIAKHRPKRLVLPSAAVFAVSFPLIAEVSPWGLVFARFPAVPAELLYTLTRVVCGIAACIVVYELCRPLVTLAWLGRRTLGIYALHPFIQQVAMGRGVRSLWLAGLIGLLGAAGLTVLIEQVAWPRMLLLGQHVKPPLTERRPG